jgi:hypothetical protein
MTKYELTIPSIDRPPLRPMHERETPTQGRHPSRSQELVRVHWRQADVGQSGEKGGILTREFAAYKRSVLVVLVPPILPHSEAIMIFYAKRYLLTVAPHISLDSLEKKKRNKNPKKRSAFVV